MDDSLLTRPAGNYSWVKYREVIRGKTVIETDGGISGGVIVGAVPPTFSCQLQYEAANSDALEEIRLFLESVPDHLPSSIDSITSSQSNSIDP